MNITIRTIGLDDIVRNLNSLDSRREFADAANKAVAEVKKWATAEVPVRTGQLQQSHVMTPATVHTARAEVYTEKEYAVPVHEGHRIVAWGHDTGRKQPPNPWMKRAAERAEGKIDSIFSEAADNIARLITR